MANYTTKANIEARLGKTLSSGESTYLTDILLPAIDNYINKYTGRLFIAEATESDTEYAGKVSRELQLVDDYQTITKVEAFDIYGTSQGEIDLTETKFLPLNAGYIDTIYAIDFTFTNYFYTVTGKKGYSSTCPEDITNVATELANSYYIVRGGITSENLEGYSYTINTELADVVKHNALVKDTLDWYKKVKL